MNGLVPHPLSASEDAVKSEPGSKLSPDPESAPILASRIKQQSPVVCKPPSLLYSVIAAPTDEDIHIKDEESEAQR